MSSPPTPARLRLERLELTAFRGATRTAVIEFDPKRPITIIFGENGTGKTSIVDGFEAIANGTLGSLEDKAGIGRAKWKYLASTERSSADLEAKLVTSAGTFAVRQAKNELIRDPAIGQPELKVLRRTTIQELLENSAGDKYRAIAPYVGCPQIEAAEAELNKLCRDTLSEADDATLLVTGAENAIIREHQAEIGEDGKTDLPTAIEWATEFMMEDPDSTDLDALVATREALQRAVDALIEEPKAREDQADAETALREATARLEAEKDRAAEGAELTLGVLEAARDHLAGHTLTSQCPVCEQDVDGETLLDSLQARLGAIDALRKATRDHEDATRDHERETTRYQAAADLVAKAIAAIPETALPSPPAADPAEMLDSLETSLAEHKSRVTGFETARTRRAGLSRQLTTLDEQRHIAEARIDLKNRAERALTLVREERQAYTDGVLSEIQALVGDLYSQIHPGEEIGSLTLQLDPKRRASLDLSATFHQSEDVPPGAYYSESHLDTLGVCIFLALARRSDPTNTILVFDDVVNSVDEAHLDRLVLLLYQQSEHFAHILITTHYRPWKEKYRWGRLRSGECHFLELQPWTQEFGVRASKARAPITELREAITLDPVDPQKLASFSGVVLEHLLDFIARTYRCRLPLSDRNAYTLGELIGGINAKLKKHLAIEIVADGTVTERIELGPAIDELRTESQVRNLLGCHFNPESFHLPPAEAVGFAEKVIALADLLCNADGALPTSNKSGSYWETRCKTKRLHPLNHPS